MPADPSQAPMSTPTPSTTPEPADTTPPAAPADPQFQLCPMVLQRLLLHRLHKIITIDCK